MISPKHSASPRASANAKPKAGAESKEVESRWSEYLEDEGREQEQLSSAQTLIEYATQDVVRWLLDNPSEEEKVSALATQERLAELGSIITRRTKRNYSPKDRRQWSATVAEVLSQLEKAGKARGNIAWTNGWPASLPKKLPGDKTESAGALKRLSRHEVTKILENKGWSLRDFATQAKVDVHTVTSYMKRKSTPYRSTRKKLADALGVSPEALPD